MSLDMTDEELQQFKETGVQFKITTREEARARVALYTDLHEFILNLPERYLQIYLNAVNSTWK